MAETTTKKPTTRKPRTTASKTAPEAEVVEETEQAPESEAQESEAQESEAQEEKPDANIEIRTIQDGVVRTINETPEHAFLEAVKVEIAAVTEKYGEQNRPHLYNLLDRQSYASREAEYKRRYDQQTALSGPGWDTIVLEEAFEAFAEPDVDKAYEELVQLAAMATLAATSLKRFAESLAAK